MRSISFVKLLEFSAILPILAICLACFYKYSFYNALNLPWITSQLQISGILLNAIPLFLDMFIGFVMATTFYLSLRYVWGGFQLYFILILLLFLMVVSTVFLNWNTNTLEAILDKSFLYYVFFFVVTVLLALDSVGLSRSVLIGISIASLMLLQSFIDYKSYKEVKKLFYQHDSFSRVYFTEEGQKIVPISYTSEDKDGNRQSYELDWRLLELVGDKAIIIVSNRIELDNIKKPQVRIVEYKLIDRVY